MILKIKIIFLPVLLGLLMSCGESSGEDTVFHLSNLYSVNTLHILYDRTFSGDISYIVSRTDLKIKTENEFNNSDAVKTDVSIAADGLIYDDYIDLPSLLSGTEYFVYIHDITTGTVESFTETTRQNSGSIQETGTITDGAGTGTITYSINFPSGYDSDSSVLWPFLLSVKGPNMSSSDNDFPLHNSEY